MPTLPEALALIALTAEGDVVAAASIRLDRGLAAAQLMELTLAGRVQVTEAGAVAVADPSPTGDAAGDAVLAALVAAPAPRSAQEWIEALAAGLRAPVLTGLLDRGIVDEQRTRRLGLFSRTRHAELDRAPERELRARLRAGILGPDEALDVRTAALASLATATGLSKELFPDAAERAEAEERLAEIGRSEVLPRALGAANDAMVKALLAATTAATAAATAATTAAVVVVT